MEVSDGEGAILAHAIRAPGISLKKGDRISAGDIVLLRQAGIERVTAAQLDVGDIEENHAAAQLARHVSGLHTKLESPFTGRCNIMASVAGIVRVDRDLVDAINAVNEAITLATLAPARPVVAGEMIATVKIIPFAVPEKTLGVALDVARPAAVTVMPFLPLRVAVMSTMLPVLRPSVIDKTVRLLQARLAQADARIVQDVRVAHEVPALAEAIANLGSVDLVVIFGASAITDRRDIVPAAIEAAGGLIEHVGMPVDPGNLLLLGRLPSHGSMVPVIGAPGCARSPKENGFDFVLRRILVGDHIDGADLRRMGVGGLLNEIVTRPQRRQEALG